MLLGGKWYRRLRFVVKIMETKNIKFTTTELNYLLDIIEQDINDYEEDFGELHRQTLEDIYNKLVNLNK